MVTRFKLLFYALILCSLHLCAGETWESTNLIWNFGLISSCDRGDPKDPRAFFANKFLLDPDRYKDLNEGDILWIPARLFKSFYEEVVSDIQVPVVLVISDGDHSFPEDCISSEQLDGLIANDNIIHIFAQNCDYKGDSKKISQIPIGVDFHTVAYKGTNGGWGMKGTPKQQENYILKCLENAPPTSQRKCKAFADFQHSDTMHAAFKRYLQFGEDRKAIFNRILPSGVIDHGGWMSRTKLWETKVQYAFSISPHGNGLDCHRTWEDLALGCIVIVKSSPLDPLYEGLPVVIVKSWDEINHANFKKWLKEYGDVSHNPAYRKRLTNHYWMEKIHKVALSYK